MPTLIINGGNPLQGCPKDWKEAEAWETLANKDKGEDDIKWKFDCGFKLDYDGDLVQVSSRFYPPKTHYGPTWDGSVSIYLLDKVVYEKKFDCKTIDELKKQVETFVMEYSKRLEEAIKNI